MLYSTELLIDVLIAVPRALYSLMLRTITGVAPRQTQTQPQIRRAGMRVRLEGSGCYVAAGPRSLLGVGLQRGSGCWLPQGSPLGAGYWQWGPLRYRPRAEA
jgi:hypothetical protein